MSGQLADQSIVCVFTYKVHEGDRGWSVCQYRDRQTRKIFKAVGTSLPQSKNVPVKLIGYWGVNKKDGSRQFEVSYYETVEPTGETEIVAFLASLKCGIGPTKAQRVFERFGEKTWDVLDHHPEMLKDVQGISDETIQKFVKAHAESTVTRNLIELFSKAGVSAESHQLSKIAEKISGAIEVIRENPYILYRKGIFSFDKCDALATYFGMPEDHAYRLDAITYKVLHDASTSGHVCLPKDEFMDSMMKQSGCSREKCAEAAKAAFSRKEIQSANKCIFLAEKYKEEADICSSIAFLMRSGYGPVYALDRIIDAYEKENFKLADSQKAAVEMVFQNQVSVITGGPGTGKTTVTKAVLYAHQKVYGRESRPLLLAPTGKAARRMSEATGFPAQTIHSAVGWKGDDTPMNQDETPLDGNLVIIDESSMMDQFIASVLLKRIERGARVVFVGDIDQLPSVGAGYVLHDLIASGVIAVTRLNVIYRQAGDNPIITNAHRINNGNWDLVEDKESFVFLETTSDGEAFEKALRMYVKMVKKYGVENVVLLNPQRNNTELSVDNFNLKLQEMLNPPVQGKFEMTVGKTVYRENDIVMELKNGENAKNGDVGVIRQIIRRPDPDAPREWNYFAIIEFNHDGDLLEYSSKDLQHITHAWCTTVHKAQGAEYETVIEVVTMKHASMLKKNLIYTGVTRAKKRVCLIGEKEALKRAITGDNAKQEQRYTLLAQRLRKALGSNDEE